MKHRLISFLQVGYISGNLLLILIFNEYFLPEKSGDRFIVIGFFIALSFLFNYFKRNGSGKESTAPAIVITVLSFIPIIILYVSIAETFTYFTFFWVGSVAIYFSIYNPENRWAILFVGIISFLISFLISSDSIYYVQLVLIIFSVLLVLYNQKKRAILFVPFLLASTFFIQDFTFYKDQKFHKGKVIAQKFSDEVKYTITRQNKFKNVFVDDQLVYSDFDYYLFYESFVHSAFQIHPDAQRIYVATQDELLIKQEVEKYKQCQTNFANTHPELTRIFTVVTGIHPAIPTGRFRAYDIIFLDENDPVEKYVDELGEKGLIVKRGVRPVGENWYARFFHIALPTLGEIKWQVLSKDSVALNSIVPFTEKIKTKWYNEEAFDLISNSGKYLR